MSLPNCSVHSTVAAIAIFGSSAGTKPMNQAWFSSTPPPQALLPGVSAVPVLPATRTPEIAALVPVPSETTPSIAVVSSSAVLPEIAWLYWSGASFETSRPSGSITRFHSCGFISLPPLATALATIAICSGVASSRSCPIASRPRSTGSFRFSVWRSS
jgi:hypothetical protein